MELLIRNCGFPLSRIEMAHNGAKALDLMERQHYDLVITDIEMPDLNGLDFIKTCREKQYRSRFIVLSGFHKFEYAQIACHFGVEDYLLKPVDTRELCRVLNRVEQSLQKDTSVNSLWYKFFSNQNNDPSYRLELERKYPHTRGWYYLLCQFKTPVSHSIFSPDVICLQDSDPTKLGVIVQQGLDSEFSLNDHLMDLNEIIRKQNRSAVLLAGERVVRFDDLNKSKESAWALLPQMFYRSWNSIIYAGEVGSFSCDVSETKAILNEIKERSLKGEESDIQIDTLYQHLLTQRLKPRICRLEFQQFLFVLLPYLEKWGIPKETLVERFKPLFSADSDQTLKDLILLIKDFIHLFYEEFRLFRKKGASALVEEVRAGIEKNFVLELNLQDFSDKYRMNKAYLGQLFKKHTGMTFNQYLNKVRIDEACILLKHTDQKIYQIAYSVGFRDPSYFVSRFEKMTGYTPLNFRRLDVGGKKSP